MAIDPNAIFSGAPVTLTYGGVACGATTAVPKFSLDVESGAPVFTNAGGPVVGTRRNRKIIPSVEVTVNEQTAQKLAWAMPGATATSSQSIGYPGAAQSGGTLATTFGAEPAAGDATIKLTSVTTIADGDFVRMGPAGVAATQANSEIVRVVTKGTAGGLDTVVESSTGTGLIADFANADEIKSIIGTILAAPAAAGAVNVKVDVATGLVVGAFIRIGDTGHYETRVVTVQGTAGVAGTGISFAVPLTRDHGLDSWCVRVAASGSTVIQPNLGLIGSSEYKDLVLTDIGADGAQLVVTLLNALSAESQELAFDDDPANPLGLTLKFTGHYAAATPTVVPCTIELIPA